LSWRAQLRKASFRGVEFFVDSAESALGRRTALHEYPLRDKPYVEDLGRKARTVSLEAYVLATTANGMNYMPGRDALVNALEQAGPGVLVHPYHGELRVALHGEAKLKETTGEGGMARFTLTFVESGEVVFPSGQANTPSIVNQRADEAELSVAEAFEKEFSVDDLPDFVSGSALEQLGNVSKVLGDLPRLSPLNGDAMAKFAPALGGLKLGLPDLVRKPLDLAKAVLGIVDQVRTIAKAPLDAYGNPLANITRDPLAALKMLRKLLAFGKSGNTAIPLTTPTRQQEAANQAAINSLVQQSAVISAARASSEMEFQTFDDAAAVRLELVGELDAQMEATKSDDVYNALASLRSATVKDISTRGANLSRVVDYTPGTTLPALVVAYDLYEDAERDVEIVARNRVRHPGFVPGGAPIEVLSDG
jgi:prophage DNA circulation protein